MAFTVFRHATKSLSLREFYATGESLPVIIYINDGFLGSEEIDNISAGQYFFIHAIYRQKRVIARGSVKTFDDNNKQLLSIPLAYPVPFCLVESSAAVGAEEPLNHLVKSNKFPFQCRLSRNSRKRFSVASKSVGVSDLSNLLLLGMYKEIYLLGNSLHQDTGSMDMEVVAIPLYIPEIRISVVNGLTYNSKEDWMYYIDSLYAFALQKINLRRKHGNQDIYLITEDTTFEKYPQQQFCEYLFPNKIMRVKDLTPGYPRPPPLPPRSRQIYEVAWLGPNTPKPQNPQQRNMLSKDDRRQLESVRYATDPEKQFKTNENEPIYEITGQFSKDYTPISELKDLKRMPVQRKFVDEEHKYLSLDTEGFSTASNKQKNNDLSPDTQRETSPDTQRETSDLLPFVDRQNPLMKALNEEISLTCNEIKSRTSGQNIPKDNSYLYDKHHHTHTETRRYSYDIKQNEDDTASPVIHNDNFPYAKDDRATELPSNKSDETRRSKIYADSDPVKHSEKYSEHDRRRDREDREYDKYGRYTVYFGSQQTSSRYQKSWKSDEYFSGSSNVYDTKATNVDQQKRGPYRFDFTKKPFEEMSIDDVGKVLQLLNMERHVKAFRDNLIDGVTLKDLDKNFLEQELEFNRLESMRLSKFIKSRHIPK